MVGFLEAAMGWSSSSSDIRTLATAMSDVRKADPKFLSYINHIRICCKDLLLGWKIVTQHLSSKSWKSVAIILSSLARLEDRDALYDELNE
jgi:hypothetical protein